MKRTPSSGSSCNALMRHLHVHAMMTSKVVHLPRCLGTKLRREATSLGPKKKQRCSRLMGSLCLWLCFPLRIRDGCVKFEVGFLHSRAPYTTLEWGKVPLRHRRFRLRLSWISLCRIRRSCCDSIGGRKWNRHTWAALPIICIHRLV